MRKVICLNYMVVKIILIIYIVLRAGTTYVELYLQTVQYQKFIFLMTNHELYIIPTAH